MLTLFTRIYLVDNHILAHQTKKLTKGENGTVRSGEAKCPVLIKKSPNFSLQQIGILYFLESKASSHYIFSSFKATEEVSFKTLEGVPETHPCATKQTSGFTLTLRAVQQSGTNGLIELESARKEGV